MPAKVVCSAAPVVTTPPYGAAPTPRGTRAQGVSVRRARPEGSGPQHLGGAARGRLDGVEDLGCGRVLAETVALARAVVVARPGEHQPQPRRQLRGVRDLLRTVVAVVRLEPDQARLAHADDEGVVEGTRPRPRERVGEHGHAARGAHEL